jgi:preprotein translocase subunit SecE
MANKISSYFKEAEAELKKVSWPSRQDTIKHTLIVIGVSAAVAAFLGLVDYLLVLGLNQVL